MDRTRRGISGIVTPSPGTVSIPQTPSAPHAITATTDVGAILVGYADSGGLQASS